MRMSLHHQRLTAAEYRLIVLCGASLIAFVRLWIEPDRPTLRGWLWGVLTDDDVGGTHGLARLATELSLLGLSIGLGWVVVMRVARVAWPRDDQADAVAQRFLIRCAEVDEGTRVDLVARAIATFPIEHVFEHLVIVSESSGRCGIEWHGEPVCEAPHGWTVTSARTWYLDEVSGFHHGTFPFPTLLNLGSDSHGREYLIDVTDVGGIVFAGVGASSEVDRLLEQWKQSPWNQTCDDDALVIAGLQIASENAEDLTGLIIDVTIGSETVTWSPRGMQWQVHHRQQHVGSLIGEPAGARHLRGVAVMDIDRSTDTCPDSNGDYKFMVRVLGEVSIETASGDMVTFDRGRSQELLAWVITHDEHPTRSRAKAAMWDVAVRPTTFANVVSDVRRSLNRVFHEELPCDWIQRDSGDDLVVDKRIVSDAQLLRRALQRSQGMLPEEVIGYLRWPVSLLRGLPFQGEPYRWPDPEGLTSELVILSISAATTLARAYLDVSDTPGVIWATGQGLRVLPGDEDLIALRMKARGGQGDVAGLRQEWDSYERVLSDEWLGGMPSPTLQRLRQELLHDRSN